MFITKYNINQTYKYVDSERSIGVSSLDKITIALLSEMLIIKHYIPQGVRLNSLVGVSLNNFPKRYICFLKLKTIKLYLLLDDAKEFPKHMYLRKSSRRNLIHYFEYFDKLANSIINEFAFNHKVIFARQSSTFTKVSNSALLAGEARHRQIVIDYSGDLYLLLLE